jgi:ribosomal protein S24E
MEIKDINETKNIVFGRREIEATIISEITPSNKETLTLLSKKLSVSEEAIKINGIYGEFGVKRFKLKANVYKSGEEKNKIERKTKKEAEGEKKEAEAAKAAKAEEKAKAVKEEKKE